MSLEEVEDIRGNVASVIFQARFPHFAESPRLI